LKEVNEKAPNSITSHEIQKAETDVLTAKIELDKTRAALKRANGGEQLDAWNNELSHIAVDRAETQARSIYLDTVSHETEAQLRDRRNQEKLADDARPKLAEADKTIADLSQKLDWVKQQQQNIAPLRVTLADEAGEKTDSASPTDAQTSGTHSKSDKNPN
jgi:hypothetical protein